MTRVTAREWLSVTVLFTILTIAATWPQAVRPGSIPADPDAWLSVWRIAWIAHQLPRDPVHLFDANIYYPERGTLAYSDATLLQGVIASPALWLGIPTPYVYTLLVMISFVFAGVGAWALVRQLTGSSSAGIVAGVIFAFTPYRFDHYMHLELLWTGWMPLILVALHRVVESGTIRAGVATGLLFVAQGLSCIYYSVLFGTVLVAFGAVLAVGLPGAALRRAAISLACGALVAGLVLGAYLVPYRQARAVVGERSVGEALIYSAGPKHYFAATPDNLLYGAFSDRFSRPEKRLFPGLIAITLAAVALWPPLTRRRIAYLVALVAAVDLSFGPAGFTYSLLLDYVMPYRGLRALARAGSIALLMIAVLAGFGWARLEQSGRLGGRPRRRLAVAAVVVAMALEYATIPRTLVPVPTRPEPVYEWLASRTDRHAVVEFPMPEEHGPSLYEPEFMYRSTFHWHPLVNGYTGNAPESYTNVLRAARVFPSDAALDRLKDSRVRYIVVHERLYGSDRYRTLTAALDARPDLARQGSFGGAGEEATVYVLNARPVHD